jgi:hypothetical protein
MADGNRNSPMVVVDVTVERVEFIEPTMADVGLGIWLSGNTQPMVMPARSVLVDGVWKVSRETVAHFAQQARMFLGPRGPFGR